MRDPQCAAPNPELPKVVAHDLTRDAATAMEADLRAKMVEGQTLGILVIVAEYESAHDCSDPDTCVECAEITLHFCKEVLRLAEKEAGERGGRILRENLEVDNLDDNQD